jgi:transposase
MHYWLYSEPTDMRKSFYSLSGIVTNLMSKDVMSGDVFIFLNRPRTRIKLLHMESGGLVLYSKILDGGTFSRPQNADGGVMTWSDLVMMVEGIVENPRYRRQRIKTLRDR